ncbi:helix-turn-helix domain-containing protein [Actinomadura sp. LD22]|uniref:Helix-turn-helix domain-containing protein n=1 Tax=Actinomadura physcomitrii TaxID=2650748 RepID=A0A6I4M4F4_9ACTN|nr:helix-turn-helix transcriptional regulator [Actinomadura physcomitrii]MVZ99046.1 helix-turn-helix domain-containing protein [Actinomadura physcomitrii]
MSNAQSPTVRHRRLARQLRRVRETSGLSMESAAAALGWSRPKLVRFETAKTRPRPSDVEAMFDLYGGDEAVKLALMQLARDIRKRGWWSAFNDVLTGSFAELEDDAAEICSWQVQCIPGLLQTSDYALALIRIGTPDDPEDVHLRRLQARMARKTILERKDAPFYRVVLDEAALRRPVGDAKIMFHQLDALLTLAGKPNVSIQIMPMAEGAHACMDGAFVILRFVDDFHPDIVYLEDMGNEIYLEDVEQVSRCNVRFDRLRRQALAEQDSMALIADIAEEYQKSDEPSQ